MARLAEILGSKGHNLTVAPTTGPGTASAIACSHIAGGADLILAAGGDGTINEVAEGMVHSQVPLGILPAGTANVLAMEMKLGAKLERAVERLEECRPFRMAVGHLQADDGKISRHFLLMAGIGLDAHIVYHVSGALKARSGKFAYWVAGWSLLGRRLPEFDVKVDGRKLRCSFALCSRVRNYGGDFEIAREISLFEDDFEVVLFEGKSSLRYVPYFAGLAANRLQGMRGVTLVRAREIELSKPEDSRVYVQVDGESAGHLPAKIRIVPQALTLLVPPWYWSRKRA